MKLRSLLMVPGDSQSGIAKAAMLASDALILDLESPVAEKTRAVARVRVANWIRGKRRRGLMVRIHPQSSDHYFHDLVTIVPARPAAIVLPRCGGLDDLVMLDHHLEAMEAANDLPRGSTRVLAVVESFGASAVTGYRDAPARLIGLCFGAEELGAKLGIAPRGPDGAYRVPLAQARAALLIAAAEMGIAAIDTPFPDPFDSEGLAGEIRAAADDGFTGKMCIHPSQVAPVTAAFTSSPERAEWARQIRRAFAATADSADTVMDGKMIDRAQLCVAERILSAFE